MTRFRVLGILVLAVLALGAIGVWRGCRTGSGPGWEVVNAPVGPGPVLCFGDSLVAGIGAGSRDGGYPQQLGRLLGRRVVAVGTPGQTAEEGLEKVQSDPALRAPLVVVTLGGNDILKQVPLERTLDALGVLFREFQQRGCTVAFTEVQGLVGGSRARAYRSLCRDHGVILIPDILGGIWRNNDLMSDGIHPNAEGYGIVAERIAEAVRPFLAATEVEQRGNP